VERRAAESAAGTVIFAENSTVQTPQEESPPAAASIHWALELMPGCLPHGATPFKP
jgi:hypothetical protein